jgi:hypothetical protein
MATLSPPFTVCVGTSILIHRLSLLGRGND